MHTGVGQAAAACKRRGKSGLRRAGCRVTPWHGDVTKRATETSPARTLARRAKVRPLNERRTARAHRVAPAVTTDPGLSAGSHLSFPPYFSLPAALRRRIIGGLGEGEMQNRL